MPLISPAPELITSSPYKINKCAHTKRNSHTYATHSFKLKRMGVMEEDDSFKKPGAVPFKWEIKPGLPIPHHHHQNPESPSFKLKPPPPLSSYKLSPVEPRTRSFRSSPKVPSERWRFERPLLAQPERVTSSGCFFSPFLKRLRSRKRVAKKVVEPDYTSELETIGRWSFSSSTTKSLSPFRRPSTVSSSVASSPQPVGHVQWAGFGLF